MVMILDADGAVLGRLASKTAKSLLGGEDVIVINAEKSVITGNPKFVKKRYVEKLAIGSPQHGPYFPRRSDMIVRRAIRGMLPYKKAKGRAAMSRLKVFMHAPADIKGDVTSMKRDINSRFITVEELAKELHGGV